MPQEQPSENPFQEQFEDAPAEQFDETPQEPRYVTIRLNGQSLEVTEAVADAIHAREADYQRQISKMGTELGTLRRQPQQAPQQAPGATQDDDLEFFQSPTKAVSKQVQKAVEDALQQMEQRNAQRDALAKWWGKFYSDNKDLSDHQDVVGYVVQQHMDDLKDLDQGTAHREIARFTRTFLGTRQAEGKTLTDRQVETERPTSPPPARSAPKKGSEAPQTISDALRALSEEHRRKRLHTRQG
jgi:hypothetical protein